MKPTQKDMHVLHNISEGHPSASVVMDKKDVPRALMLAEAFVETLDEMIAEGTATLAEIVTREQMNGVMRQMRAALEGPLQ